MRIAVNAINLQSAGGLTVALNFIDAIKNGGFKVHLLVFAPLGCGYEAYESEDVEVFTIPKKWNATFRRPFVDYFWLPKQIEVKKPDVIFTMGNFAVPSKIPQGVLFMWPYAIYPDEKPVWDRMSTKDKTLRRFKIKIFQNRLKYANVVFPQTKTSQERLKRFYPESIKETEVIPMAFSNIGMKDDNKISFFERVEGFKYLVCLTRYYPHKNVEILLDAARLIKEKNLPIKIITTIGGDQHKDAQKYIDEIAKNQLQEVLLNIGPIPIESVPALYDQIDGMILPTLLESFSATYVDSMKYGKAIFTSNLDFAIDACEDCAFYFDPYSAQSIVNIIEEAFANPQEIEIKIQNGYQRIKNLPNWNQVTEKYLNELNRITTHNENS